MKKSFLILVAILVTGLYSFGGNYYGPNGGSFFTIQGSMPSTWEEDREDIDVTEGQHYYLFADIYTMSCCDIDVCGWMYINYPEFIRSVHALGNREGVIDGEDSERGVFEEDASLTFNWQYNIGGGTAYVALYLYIY